MKKGREGEDLDEGTFNITDTEKAPPNSFLRNLPFREKCARRKVIFQKSTTKQIYVPTACVATAR